MEEGEQAAVSIPLASSGLGERRVAEPGAAWWLATAFGAFWAGLLAHEAAHYAIARLVSADWTSPALTWQRAASAAAGPVLTLIIVAGCAAISDSPRRLHWVAVATAIGAASRLVLIAVPTMLGKANDENTVGRVIAVSPQVLWLTEAVLTLFLMWILLRRRPVSRQSLLLCCGGVLVGWVSEFTFGRAVGLPI